MVSGLRVNFYKSSNCGVNMNPTFLEVASIFLHRGVLFPSFQIFGNFLGDSPRKENMWKHIVDNLRKRLVAWREKLLSVG